MTPPPTIRVSPEPPIYASFPNGVVVFPKDLLNPLQKEMEDSLGRFELGQSEKDRLLSLLQEGHFNSILRFHEAVIPVPKAPDLKIIEGGGMCMELNSHQGKLSMPHPIGLGGFVAWGGFFDFCQIGLNEKDRIILSECPCAFPTSKDITPQVLDSPAGALFPDGKIQAVPFSELLKIKLGGGSGGGVGDILLNALNEVVLKGKIETGFWVDDPPGTKQGSCHPLWASLELFLDFPVLKNTIGKELYKQLDFSGVKEGSFLDWPRFQLSNLPLPDAFKISRGEANLSVRYRPETKTTEIFLKDLDADVSIPELFGKDPVSLKGGLTITLKAGGEISLHFDRLRVGVPSFPKDEQKALSFAGVLDGDMSITRDSAGNFALQEAHLKLSELDLKTLEGKGIQFPSSAFAFSGFLKGSLEVDFVPTNTEETLLLGGSLQGGLWGESPDRILDIQKIDLDLRQGFRKVGDRYLPNLGDADTTLSADVTLKDKDKNQILEAQGFWLSLQGNGSEEKDGALQQGASLETGVENLQVGKLSLSPHLFLDLLSRQKGEEVTLEGEGDLSLESKALGLELGANLKLDTDFKKLNWVLLLLQDQRLGDWDLKGELEAKGGGEISGDLLGIFHPFKIETKKPFEIGHDGKVFSKGITLSGQGNEKGEWIRLKIPSLQGNRIELTARRAAGGDRLFGEFKVGRPPIRLNAGSSLKEISLSGNYQSVPLRQFFETPRVFLKSRAHARLDGTLSGPLDAQVEGSLHYDPDKKIASLWINPKKGSSLKVGPLLILGETATLEGRADLQGTWLGVQGKNGWSLGGSQVGVKNGDIFLNLEQPADPAAKRIPLLSHFSTIADQLWNLYRGVAYAGGDGIKVETDLNLGALEGTVDTDSGKRHIVYIVDQLPFSLDGYWRLFKKMQKDREKSESTGGNP